VVGEDRYDGRPFLRLLDSYVLWSMHVLDEASERRLETMEPKLNDTFGVDGLRWYEIVETRMRLTPSSRTQAREEWQRAQAKSAAPIDPLDFAYDLADKLAADRG
jgi:hypothetical protein